VQDAAVLQALCGELQAATLRPLGPPRLLHASSLAKYSCHAVLHALGTPDGCCGSVADVGALVRAAWRGVPQSLQWVVDDSGATVSVFDLGVYRCQQQFRVPYSSKLGQDRPMLPAAAPALYASTLELWQQHLVSPGASVVPPACTAVASPRLCNALQPRPVPLPVTCPYPALQG
jgi:hypothetical protein